MTASNYYMVPTPVGPMNRYPPRGPMPVPVPVALTPAVGAYDCFPRHGYGMDMSCPSKNYIQPEISGIPGHKESCVCGGCDGLRGLGADEMTPEQLKTITDLISQGLSLTTAIVKAIPGTTPAKAAAIAPQVAPFVPAQPNPLLTIAPLALLAVAAFVLLK